MMTQFCNLPEDVQWLKETHLKGVILPTDWKDFKSFFIDDETSPQEIQLYMHEDPSVTDPYIGVGFKEEAPIYCTYQIYEGNNDKAISEEFKVKR